MLDDKQNIAWMMYACTVLLLIVPFIANSAVTAPKVGTTHGLEAKAIYQKFCSVCHGDKGDGDSRAAGGFDPRPRNFTAPESAAELSRARMIRSVTNGRPGTAMVGHAKKLGPQQIESVVDYIRATFMQLPSETRESALRNQATDLLAPNVISAAPSQAGMKPSMPADGAMGEVATAAADMTLSLPQKLKGNVDSGRAFFMKNCFTCHGVKGDGNGPRAYFIAPRPRNFTSAESRQAYNRPRLFDAISNGKRGTVMPAWGKVLNEQQIANVAEFVFQAYIKGSYKLNLPETPAEDDKKKDY